MSETRVQFNTIVSNQLPAYVREDYPLISELLKQYYLGQEYQGGPVDLIQNIDRYIKLDNTTNLSESVGSYLKNINTHKAYEELRQERRKLRMNGEDLLGSKLANYLENYSERDMEYVKDIKELMETNNFMKFDKVRSLMN